MKDDAKDFNQSKVFWENEINNLIPEQRKVDIVFYLCVGVTEKDIRSTGKLE